MTSSFLRPGLGARKARAVGMICQGRNPKDTEKRGCASGSSGRGESATVDASV